MNAFIKILAGTTAALVLLQGRTPAGPQAKLLAPAAIRVTTQGDNLKPFVALRPTGGVYLSWAQRKSDKTSILFTRSQDGVHVDTPVQISLSSMQLDLGAEAGPNIAVDAKGAIYVAWAAGPKSAAPPTLPTHNTSASAAGVTGHSGSHAGGHFGQPTDIWMARSDDDGKSFSQPVRVNDDPAGTVHRFPFIEVDAQGGICVSWLDKRKKTTEGADLTRVFFARSTDGARTFGRNVDATGGQSYPICHCCRVASTHDSKQGLMIAFRNDINDRRDMFVVNSPDCGQTFTAPKPLEHTGWTISYCPMDGPSISIDATGNLHAVWMSGAKIAGKPLFHETAMESSDASKDESKVLYSRTAPGTAVQQKPVLLGEGHHPRLALGPDGEAFIIWHNDSSVLLARFGSGINDKPEHIQIGDQKGAASYPSLALAANGTIYCAWQEAQPDDSVQIYLTGVPVSVFSAR